MPTIKEQYYCKKCNRTMAAEQFYGSNNREKYPEGKLDTCKKCVTMHVDNWNPETYVWILQECDVPYVPKEWTKLMATYANNPEKLTGMTILGKYLSKMKLKQYKDYRYKDTDFLQELEDSKLEQTMKRQGYGMAEITAAIEDSHNGVNAVLPPPPPPSQNIQFPTEDYFAIQAGEDDFDDDLTDEDKTYLRLKWGKAYRPEEWVKLEQLYEEMMNSYDIQGAGHIDNLKLLCKTSLKANQLIDMGDVEGFQKMSKVYDSLMKSGKFTAAQNKAEDGEEINSIGELVSICEKQGFIPKYYTDGPQDKADRVIEDLKKYTKDLVSNETNLDTMFESAQRQIEEEQERIANAAEAGENNAEEEDKLFDYDAYELTDKDYEDMSDFIEAEALSDEEVE